MPKLIILGALVVWVLPEALAFVGKFGWLPWVFLFSLILTGAARGLKRR